MDFNHIFDLVKSKKLLHFDCGLVGTVRPTGQYVDLAFPESPDFYEPRHRYLIEVKSGFFGSPKWVPAACLKIAARLER